MQKPDPGMETCPDCCGHGHRAGNCGLSRPRDYDCPPQVLCETCWGSGQVVIQENEDDEDEQE
jgi:hypothetical protein